MMMRRAAGRTGGECMTNAINPNNASKKPPMNTPVPIDWRRMTQKGKYYALRASAARKDFAKVFLEPTPEPTKSKVKNRQWQPCFLYFLTTHPSFFLLPSTHHVPQPVQTSWHVASLFENSETKNQPNATPIDEPSLVEPFSPSLASSYSSSGLHEMRFLLSVVRKRSQRKSLLKG
jgi:hypothetical protein